jgi:flagellar basal-body rod protein FlgC
MGTLFDILDTASNSLATERQVMAYAADNVSNMYTPGYKAKTAVVGAKGRQPSFDEMVTSLTSGRGPGVGSMILEEHPGMGSMVSQVATDYSKGSMLYLPKHPLANGEGYVESSNVDAPKESIKMLKAVGSYKTILSIVEMVKASSKEALNMTKNA